MSSNQQHNSNDMMKQFHKIFFDLSSTSYNLISNLFDVKSSTDNINDPFNINKSLMQAYKEYLDDPTKLLELNIKYTKDYLSLIKNVIERSINNDVSPLFPPDSKDKRFADEMWDKNPTFDFIRQAYFLNSKWLTDSLHKFETLPAKDIHKLNFFSKLIIDSLAPSNFAISNPEVIKSALSTNGMSLIKGAQNLLRDLSKSKSSLSIPTSRVTDFEIGKTIAATPGKVIYQNDVMQLIQYQATTDKVHEIPLIIMPAWINKYYILDLQAKNSFVKWLVDKGYTVYMISWANANESHSNKEFTDYMDMGPLTAIDIVKKHTKCQEVNFIGYCLGGTMLAITIAYLKAKSTKPFPIKSATFLAVLVDFESAGDLGVFIDESQISSIEKRMGRSGYLKGSDMAQTFSIIRANDMIWSYYINNYLLGKDPFPFDILYWNADSTHLPSKLHSFCLRNLYLNNMLVKPGSIKLNDVAIDISKNDLPTYVLATRQDHIVPWDSSYKATQIYSGQKRFVLSGSGHVAGVVNHPKSNKYNYWTNDKLVENPNNWLEGAKDNPGSWWEDWDKWCSKLSGKQIVAPKVDDKYVVEDAPGSYLKVRID